MGLFIVIWNLSVFTSLIGKEVLISVLNCLLKYNKIAITLYRAHREVVALLRRQRGVRVLLGGTSVALLRCWRSSLITALIRLASLCRWDSVYNFRFPGCHSWTIKSHHDLMLQVAFPGLGEHLHVSVFCVLFYWTDVLCNYWKALFF